MVTKEHSCTSRVLHLAHTLAGRMILDATQRNNSVPNTKKIGHFLGRKCLIVLTKYHCQSRGDPSVRLT